MKHRFWLAPVLFVTSLFASAAAAQTTPPQPGQLKSDLPNAPSFTLKLPDPVYKPADVIYALPYRDKDAAAPGGFIGDSIRFVQNHTLDNDEAFDFAIEKKVTSRFSLVAGKMNDPRDLGGPQAAARMALRVTTGLPDDATRQLRGSFAGGAPLPQHGGDAFGIGIRFRLGR